MRALAAEEKIATVMLYTRNLLVRGELICRENARVSIWLRTQGVPNYIHIFKPQVISFSATPPRQVPLSEIFIATTEVIAFHLAPPEHDPLDYEPGEANRIMQPVDALVGSFLVRASLRISSHTDLSTSLDVMRAAWISLYEAQISNSSLPTFNVQVPMLLVNPNHVSFGLALA